VKVGDHEYDIPPMEQLVYLINGFWRERYDIVTKELERKDDYFHKH
jgi:hypothetical protein